MGRPARHTTDAILDAARELVLQAGARAATMDGVVAVSGAPKGSIYHRFATLDDLLAAMWLRAVQRSQTAFLAALEQEDRFEGAVQAGLTIHDFVHDHPADARLLASMRRRDLLQGVSDPELARGLREANDELVLAFRSLSRALYGRTSKATVERALCAIVDIPQGAVRRHLIEGSDVPKGLRSQLEAAIRGALKAPETSRDGVRPSTGRHRSR